MTSVQKTTDPATIQPVASTAPAPVASDKDTPKEGSSEFDVTLKSLLNPSSANQVSEEELFSALVQERIKASKGDEALTKFQELLGERISSMKKSDGFVPVEDATKSALSALRDAGELTSEEADTLYSKAFAAAQLDDNKDALFDNRGGPGDTTIAVATMEQALLASRVQMEKFDNGTEEVTMRTVDEASAGKSAAGAIGAGGVAAGGASAGFLFKPISDSDGKLAVLLPPMYAGLVQGARLLTPSGDVIEEGRYGGNGNGGREHFRFSQPGGSYPPGVVVEATLNTGEVIKYTITDPSQRTENLEPTTEEEDKASSTQ